MKAKQEVPNDMALGTVLARPFYDSTLGFVLYAIAMIGCLGMITALIERAAP